MTKNILFDYITSRELYLKEYIKEWEDIVKDPPPEDDALEGYYKLEGQLEELMVFKKFLEF